MLLDKFNADDSFYRYFCLLLYRFKMPCVSDGASTVGVFNCIFFNMIFVSKTNFICNIVTSNLAKFIIIFKTLMIIQLPREHNDYMRIIMNYEEQQS